MKKTIIRIIFIFRLPFLFRFLLQRRKLTVIYYHDTEEAYFDTQIMFLKKYYNIINLETLQKYLYDKTYKIPNYSLLVVFDDGHVGNYELLNVFKKYDIRPIIFLTAKIIDTLTPFWFMLPFNNVDEMERLKSVPDTERRNYLEKEFAETQPLLSPQALTAEMIHNMVPYVDFQSHTLDHPCLPYCSYDESREQIIQSKKLIEELSGNPVIAMAYPNGDFTAREVEICREAGYTIGFASTSGFVDKKADPFTLNRLSVNDTADFYEFVLRVTGVWFNLKKIKFF